MSDKPVIELTLKVKGVTLKLSVGDAKGLYEALGKVVGEKYPWYVTTTYPSGVYPWYLTPFYPYTVYYGDKVTLTANST